jgi:glycosyltransferase involved in cell wall biosynthesis
MGKPEKLEGVVSLASNSPGTPTGYGQQAQYLVERFVRHGVHTAALSNFGLEGRFEDLRVKGGKVAHYPRGLTQYSDDVMPIYHAMHRAGREDLPHALMTLYDVWVYNNTALDELPIVSWVPLDHVSIPPGVLRWVAKSNVTPVAMSPHGQRQLESQGIESVYIPHMVDVNTYKPRADFDGVPTREFMGVPDDAFLIGMVAANKANRVLHRKAFAENLLAVAMFMKENPNTHLYLHTEPSPSYAGFDLPRLLRTVGIPDDRVIWPDPVQLRMGYTQTQMAALYTSFDVLLATSYGEGFGVPTIEAQACGTRVIGSGWAATQDLVAEDSWLVDGHFFWGEGQQAWWKIPDVSAIVKALRLAAEADRGASKVAQDFAQQFAVETVWDNHWMPFWRNYFGA